MKTKTKLNILKRKILKRMRRKILHHGVYSGLCNIFDNVTSLEEWHYIFKLGQNKGVTAIEVLGIKKPKSPFDNTSGYWWSRGAVEPRLEAVRAAIRRLENKKK